MTEETVIKFNFSKEEVEKFKEKDILEEMLKEMAGEFPAFSEVFVRERDLFLSYALRRVAKPLPHPNPAIGQYIKSLRVTSPSSFTKYMCFHVY